MTALHEEVLTSATARVFERLGTTREIAGFYLAGGTALALVFGHRRSDDLDLFSERPWSWERVSAGLATAGDVGVDRQEPGTFVGSVGGVRVSLFHYPHVLLNEPIATRFGVPLADPLDVGCMKLVAVSQRGSRKDFIDLYHLGRAGYDIEVLIDALGRKVPGVEYNPVHILRSLAYFEDAEEEPEPVMLVEHDWADVRRYCVDQAQGILDRIEREQRT